MGTPAVVDICTHCHSPIAGPDLEWREHFVCAASSAGPAEYEDRPYHRACLDAAREADERAADPHEAAWARARSRGDDDFEDRS